MRSPVQVDSYLEALLSTGLSTEYVKKEGEKKTVSKNDADVAIAAKYYVNQILSLDEEALQDAWLKVIQELLNNVLRSGYVCSLHTACPVYVQVPSQRASSRYLLTGAFLLTAAC